MNKILLFFLISSSIYCQVQPKWNPNKEYKSVYTGFQNISNRVIYMKSNISQDCISGKIYNNLLEKISIKEQLMFIDKNDANFACLFSIKMSENSMFVFFISNICNFNNEETGYVNVTFFNYTFGDIDSKSIKNLLIKKKRLFINNNKFTEELAIGKMIFKIYSKVDYSEVSFAGRVFKIVTY